MATVAWHNKDGLAEPFLRWQASILGTMELVKPSLSSDSQPAKDHAPKP
jgi:hypothetical protein